MNWKIPAAIAAIAMAIAGGAAVATGAGDDHPPAKFGILERAAAAGDQLTAHGEAADKINAKAARNAGRVGNADVFIAPNTDGTRTCLVGVDAAGESYACYANDDLQDNARALGWSVGASDVNVAVLVPDAYTEASVDDQAIKVANNVALTTRKDGQKGELRLKGPDDELVTEYNFGYDPKR